MSSVCEGFVLINTGQTPNGHRKVQYKWGTCSIEAKRIWLNLELAKKPIHCLEYIIVHELVHLFERKHSDRFLALMGQYMPKWKMLRDELNKTPVSHVSWEY
jgi:predicted metal-dependent hydrolase